jgi:drug/metabolite transporter (DMT)-like permease
MTSNVKGSLAASGALAAVGSLVAAADAIDDYPIPAGQALRYAVAGTVLLALLRGRLPRLTVRDLVLAAALAATGLVLFNVCVIGAVHAGDPATVGVIVGCVPVILAIAAPLLERRRPSPALVGAAGVVAVGAAGVEQVGGGLSPTGILLALGALTCEACFSLIAVPLLKRLTPLQLSTCVSLLAVPMAATWAVIAGGPRVPTPTTSELVAFAYLALVVTVCGFVLWYRSVGLLGVERAGLFSGVLPISALVSAAVIGAGGIAPVQLAAVAFVALGITVGMRAAAGSVTGFG